MQPEPNPNSSPNPNPQAQVYSRQQYSTMQFWDSRYKQKPSYFDWYADFNQLQQSFQKQYQLCQDNSILMLGCGNSKLSEQMYQAGYRDIFNIDISPSVIQQMREVCKGKGYDQMKWEVMDATDMNTIPDGTFDVVIDKGTLDALISGNNIDICVKMLRQSMRVLKRDGQFILITYGSPEGRKRFFQKSIGLNMFDYYFTRVDLSNMSTLINLMRSNLGNKPLSSITKDSEAMKKSLIQFNLIKVLRRNRKNEKKYIIWSNILKSQQIEQQSLFQPQQAKKPQQQANKSPQPTPSPKSQAPQSINYNPKKQSFCYVYSIKRKFAYDIQETVKNQPIDENKNWFTMSDQMGNYVVDGDENLLTFGVYVDGQAVLSELGKAVRYLRVIGVPNNRIVVYRDLQSFSNAKQEVKFVIKQGKSVTVPAINKKIYQIKVDLEEGQICQLQNKFKVLCRELTEKGGLQAHPSPRNYAYLGILMQRMQVRSKFNQFLRKYWYPTYRLHQIKKSSPNKSTAYYHLSVPPTWNPIPDPIPQSQSKQQPQPQTDIKNISKLLSIPAQHIQIKQIRKGYLNYYDPRLITLANFCAMNYCEGVAGLHLLVDEFGEQSEKAEEFATQWPTLYIPRDSMARILARMISAI